MISPILEKLTEDSSIKTASERSLDLVTVDTDKEFELAQKYQVSLSLCFQFGDRICLADTITTNSDGI